MALTFTRLQWEDFVALNSDVFVITDNGDGTVTIVDAPGEVLQEGTSVNSENLNRIEQGIHDIVQEDSNNLKKGDNLNSLADKAISRSNLGLGTSATLNQDQVLLKTNNLSELTASASTARNNIGLGSTKAAAYDLSDFLLKAGNLSGLSNVTTARGNLGLGTAATLASTDILLKADNLSGLNNLITSRSNLGLKTGATKNITLSTAVPIASQVGEGDLWFVYV